jgi:hypothetical protein
MDCAVAASAQGDPAMTRPTAIVAAFVFAGCVPAAGAQPSRPALDPGGPPAIAAAVLPAQDEAPASGRAQAQAPTRQPDQPAGQETPPARPGLAEELEAWPAAGPMSCWPDYAIRVRR